MTRHDHHPTVQPPAGRSHPNPNDDVLDEFDGTDSLDEDETLDEWDYFGWLDLLPAGAAALVSLHDEGLVEKVDFDSVMQDAVTAGEFQFLEGDPVWPVIAEKIADEAGVIDDRTYDEYLEDVRADRRRWLQLVARDPALGVTSLNALVDLMVRLGLLVDTGGSLEVAEETPDPVDLLPLDDEEVEDLLTRRLEDDAGILAESLHEFIFHETADRLQTTVDKLSQISGLPTETVRLALAVLVGDSGSGLTADRFGPLTVEAVAKLADHQKFTLVVDRSVPAIADSTH
jgi:hypothetical protein